MRNKFLLFLVVLFFEISTLSSQTVEVENLDLVVQEIEKLNKECLVIFDVDETLFAKTDNLLRRNKETTKIENELFSLLRSKKDCKTKYYSIITMGANVEVIDARSYEIVDSLNQRSIPVVVLTAVVPGKYGLIENMVDFRMMQLEKLGFDFSLTFPHLDSFILHENQVEILTFYKKGVIFSGTIPKGEVLKKFFELIDWYPKKVILIDDRKENHDSLEQVLGELQIEYLGFHYRGVESLPNNLDEKVARFQIHYLLDHEVWLSDSQAAEVMREKEANL